MSDPSPIPSSPYPSGFCKTSPTTLLTPTTPQSLPTVTHDTISLTTNGANYDWKVKGPTTGDYSAFGDIEVDLDVPIEFKKDVPWVGVVWEVDGDRSFPDWCSIIAGVQVPGAPATNRHESRPIRLLAPTAPDAPTSQAYMFLINNSDWKNEASNWRNTVNLFSAVSLRTVHSIGLRCGSYDPPSTNVLSGTFSSISSCSSLVLPLGVTEPTSSATPAPTTASSSSSSSSASSTSTTMAALAPTAVDAPSGTSSIASNASPSSALPLTSILIPALSSVFVLMLCMCLVAVVLYRRRKRTSAPSTSHGRSIGTGDAQRSSQPTGPDRSRRVRSRAGSTARASKRRIHAGGDGDQAARESTGPVAKTATVNQAVYGGGGTGSAYTAASAPFAV